jgi:hypothetical protein
MQEEEEKFSDDPTENMKIENDFLKLKMKAQYGDGFFMQEGDDALPAEIENMFLKQMMHFEENAKKAEYVTLYEKIGSPAFKKVEDISSSEMPEAITSLLKLMKEHSILLNINDGPYSDDVIYRFITEELFEQEIEKENLLEGGQWNFIYEEFHPNDRKEIEENTHAFLQHWFTKGFDEYSSELANDFLTADGKQLDREVFYKKVNMFFDSFVAFKNDGYNIDAINFELHEDDAGIGHAEGVLRYDAEMENGEVMHYEGPFKLYMQREDKYWSIFYFVIPGFVW